MHPHLISQLIAARQADLIASAQQQRLARQARAARRARPPQRGRAAPMLAALRRLPRRRSPPHTIQTPTGRPRPGHADADTPLTRLTPTHPAQTGQPPHHPPARAQRAHRAPAPGHHPPQAQPLLPRRGRGLGRAHRARLRTPNSHAISAGHRACRPPSGEPSVPPSATP